MKIFSKTTIFKTKLARNHQEQMKKVIHLIRYFQKYSSSKDKEKLMMIVETTGPKLLIKIENH